MMSRFGTVLVILVACGGPATKPVPTPESYAPPPAPVKPEGYVTMTVLGVLAVEDGNTVVLVDEKHEFLVPLGIGGTEAASIALRHAGDTFVRPLTHDLLDAVLQRLGAKLLQVQVDELRDSTFIGSVFVSFEGKVIELDARPSDAIALALGNHAPIYVARKVVQQAGIRAEDLPQPAPDKMEPAPDIPIKPQ